MNKNKYEEYLRKKQLYEEFTNSNQRKIKELDKRNNFYDSESKRIQYNLDHCESIINELSNEFKNETALKKEDFAFLFLAVGLQLIRQYYTKFEDRTPHDISEIESKKNQKKVFDKIGENPDDNSRRFYYASTQSILSTPGVPYDAVKGSKIFNLGDGINKTIGLSGDTHRIKTLGHDPILGYVFGTCNIMTSTLTTNSFRTFHVKGGSVTNNGDTGLMFKYSVDRSINDPQALVVSLVKQYFHIQSDMYSIDGIQLPFLSVVSTDVVKWLNEIGLDFGNMLTIGKQAGLSFLINQIIFMLYSLSRFEGDKGIIKAKGSKIVTYSDVIASTCNIIKVMVTKNIKDLDLGGLIVTIYQVVKNKHIQQQIRDEYVYGSYEKMLLLRKYNDLEEE